MTSRSAKGKHSNRVTAEISTATPVPEAGQEIAQVLDNKGDGLFEVSSADNCISTA